MAKKKKKSWKKKLLKAALIGGALYGGSKLLGRGAKGNVLKTAASEDANIGVTHPALTDTAPVAETVVPAVTKSYLSKMQGGNPDDPTGHIAQITRANAAKRAAKNAAMNYQRSQTFDAQPRTQILDPMRHQFALKGGGIAKRGTGAAYKSGGRVTGIAKRGFGRALMKGKN